MKKEEDDLILKVSLQYELHGENCLHSVERLIHGIAVIVPVEGKSNHKLDTTMPDFASLNTCSATKSWNVLLVSHALLLLFTDPHEWLLWMDLQIMFEPQIKM